MGEPDQMAPAPIREALKVEVDKERDSVLRIWDGEVWQSGYYYVNDFIIYCNCNFS